MMPALVVGGSTIIALCAQITMGYPVPITGQTFAVLMMGALLGSRRGTLLCHHLPCRRPGSLPVFSQGKAGLAHFLGQTGGYLVGFILAAWIVGSLSERTWDRRSATTVVAMVLGNLAIYVCGLAWLFCLIHLFGNPLSGSLSRSAYIPS